METPRGRNADHFKEITELSRRHMQGKIDQATYKLHLLSAIAKCKDAEVFLIVASILGSF